MFATRHFQTAVHSPRWLIATLVLIMMLAGITAEAAACGPEPDSDLTAEVAFHAAHGEQVPADEEPGKHKACAHGHCHHGNHVVSRTADIALGVRSVEIHFASGIIDHPARKPDSLKRPPRA